MKKITKNSRKLILGMAIGDGYISKGNFLSIRHREKQLGYLQWKRNLLKANGINVTDIQWVQNNNYGAYEFRTLSYKFIHNIRNSLYMPYKNISTPKILKNMSPLTIAIWYMDDGSISTQSRNGKPYRSLITISTCISKEDNQVIIDYFANNYGIKMNQRKMRNKYSLVISSKENVCKFLDIVRPYVNEVDCMGYKLKSIYN